jgi:hypothetical protein
LPRLDDRNKIFRIKADTASGTAAFGRPAEDLSRGPDERQAETSYHAEKSVTIEQVTDKIELTVIRCLRVRRINLPPTVFM